MKTLIQGIAIVVVALLHAGVSHGEAGPPPPCTPDGFISIMAKNLKAKQFEAPITHQHTAEVSVEATVVPANGDRCELKISRGGVISRSPDQASDGCAALFPESQPPTDTTLNLSFSPPTIGNAPVELDIQDPHDGVCTDQSGGTVRLTVKLLGTSSGEVAGGSSFCRPPPDTGGESWCTNARAKAFGGHELVCIDVDGSWASTTRVPPDNVIRPNQGVLLVIRHAQRNKLKVSYGGTRGLTIPEVEVQGGTELHAERLPSAPSPPEQSNLRVTTFPFPPRKAGSADIDLEIEDASASRGKAVPYTVPLEVDQAFWGAVRLGIAGFYTINGGSSYEARLAPGSDQLQIYESASPGVGFEIVVGFAPYLIDLHWGGRFYGSRWQLRDRETVSGNDADLPYKRRSNAYVAPYIGFGVVGTTGEEAIPFGSLYLGWEVEFARHFSVAITYTMHRVTRLATGYEIGSPVDATTNFTSTGPGHGIAIVLNGSPSFLQFARDGGRAASSSEGEE